MHKLKEMKYLIRVLYIIGIIVNSFPLAMLTVTSSIPIYFLLLFVTLLLCAEYIKGSILQRYIYTYLSLIVFFTVIHIYLPDFDVFSRFIFNLIVLIAYLLPDFISPIVTGAGIVLTFLRYKPIVGDEVIGGMLGATMMAFLFSIIGYLMRRSIYQRNQYYLQSIKDSLTGLYTLNYIVLEGQKFLDQGDNVSILMVDLNDFKQINDTYGHIIGNQIIIQFAEMLQNISCDSNSIIGRLGGDEYVYLLQNCDAKQLDLFVRKIHAEVNRTVFFGDANLPPITLACAIGKANTKETNAPNIQELLKIADSDMYYNKYQKYKLLKDLNIDLTTIPEACLSYLKSLQEKDMYTYVHSQYVAYYACLIAKELKLPDKVTEDIFVGGWLHDIGKILIPNTILRKPGKLSEEEYKIIKEHVILGTDLLSSIDLSDTIRNAIKQHQERWDGKGYPYGITGEETSLEGRILQIADTFSALTIKRLYKSLISLEDAIEEMKKNSGTQFDPNLIIIFDNIIKQNDAVANI